jgi:integrase
MARARDHLHRREGGIFAFSYKDVAGLWKEKYTGTTDRAQAKRVRQQFLHEFDAGILPTDMSSWRLTEAAEWWNEFRRPRISEASRASEPYRLQHLPAIVGNKRLKELANKDLDDYVTARLAVPVGAWSINREIQLWSLILRKAKVWRRLAEDYRPLKTKASDIGRALTRQQLRHLAEIAETNRDWEAAFYGSVLAANTGLRGGEIKRLKIGSIDLERRRIRIVRSSAKTDSSARFVELNRDATEAAARLLFRADSLGSNRPEHYLMPKNLSRISYGKHKGSRGYDPLQHQAAWDTAWASLTAECGFPDFRFHDLRHTFISHMVELGVPLGVIQTFVGHISARMVRRYTHVTSGAARAAVELLDSQPILAPLVSGEQAITQ